MRRIAMMGAAAIVLTVLAVAPSATASSHERFRSDRLMENDTFEWSFDAPGQFTYHCTTHPSMRGSVIVEVGASMSGTVDVDIVDLDYDPGRIEVAPGTKVVWTSQDDATTSGPGGHTVTEDEDSPGPDKADDGGAADDEDGGALPGVGLVGLVGVALVALTAARRRFA